MKISRPAYAAAALGTTLLLGGCFAGHTAMPAPAPATVTPAPAPGPERGAAVQRPAMEPGQGLHGLWATARDSPSLAPV